MSVVQHKRLLDSLEAAKGQFGAQAAERVMSLLKQSRQLQWSEVQQLIRFHETVLYLRACPQDQRVLNLADKILFGFGKYVLQMPADALLEMEEAEVSGIAGTALSTYYSHVFTQSLARRYPKSVEIDWDNFAHPERIGRTLAKLLPAAFEDWAIAPHADWRKIYQTSGLNLASFLERVEPEIFDLFEVPILWRLGNTDASRSRARISRKNIFYHDGPFLTRKDLRVADEFSRGKIRVRRLAKRPAQEVWDVIVDASAVRYRELYGFEYPDLANVFHAGLGRGMDIYFFGVPREWKLPNREYVCGMYFKNGVPVGYVECMFSKGRMEIGFNLYYTFRQGETAWLYVRLMKLFHQHYGVTSFSIDPYQLGHENEEAIASGAFWFYYKLGFRPEKKALAAMAAREMEKISADTAYRCSAATLRKLAAGAVVVRIL
jgi:hypothetical protein